MIKHFLISLFLLCQLAILAKDKVTNGKITENICRSLVELSIGQLNTNNYTNSGYITHLVEDKKYDTKFKTGHAGYKPLTSFYSDTISDLLENKVNIDTISDKFNYFDKEDTFHKRKLKFGVIAFIQEDFIFNDFGDFRALLKDYNVDLMNKSSGILSYELAGTYKRYYAGFNWGWAEDRIHDHDSLDIEFNTTQYGLHFGYIVLNTKRLLVTPKVAIKWNRYRLLNNDKENRIPIEQYVANRDLDLRFNQMTGFVGFNLSYKIYKFNLLPTDYWTFGIYGGYAFKMHDKPWIYSRGNRLTSEGKIGVKNYNIGIHFSFNFDGQ